MSGDEEAITWIHLSDFHAGQRGKAVWNQLETELKASVLAMKVRLGVPDIVLFTGDLANRGTSKEYGEVDRLLDQLNEWLGLEVPVFAVPGNHDVVRPTRRGQEGEAHARHRRDHLRRTGAISAGGP